LDSTPSRSDGEKLMEKSEMLQSMATMASLFSTTSQIQDAFLPGKVEIKMKS
jgi:hypothetical protein